MLRIKSIKKAGAKETPTNGVVTVTYGEAWTTKHFVVLRFAQGGVSSILASTFAVGDFTLTSSLEELAFGMKVGEGNAIVRNEQTGAIDWEKTFEKVQNHIIGTELAEAFGFQFSVSEIYGGKYDVFHINDLNRDVTSRYVVGVGANEAQAKENALSRIKSQMDFAVSQQRAELRKAQADDVLTD